MKILILTVLLFSFNCFSQENEKKIKYDYGIGIEYNTLITETKNKDVNYFTSNYSNGTSTSLLFKNKLWVKKWYLSFDAGLNLIRQKQNLVFSNAIDPIINFNVVHKLILWQFNFGFARVFDLSNSSKFTIELGATVNGFFSQNTPVSDLKGSFESDFISIDDFGQDNSSNENYEYLIDYDGIFRTAPWVKIGLIQEYNKGALEFGLSYTRRRMEYDNFIIIKSTNYTAISESRSKSDAIGIYLNWFFRK